MSWLSKITGQDRARNQLQSFIKSSGQKAAQQESSDPTSPASLASDYGQALTDAKSGGGYQDAFNKTVSATMMSQLPQLKQSLQLTNEDAIRRGVSTGDLGSSLEGDVVNAWQNNLANAFAGQSLNAYGQNQNQYLSLLTGGIDRNTANANAQQKKTSGLWGGLGGIAGWLVGGPAGAGVGSAIGSGIGSYFG